MIGEDWQVMGAFSLIGAMFLLGVVGIGLAAAMPGIDRWNKGYFMAFFGVLATCMASSFVEMHAYGKPMHSVLVVAGFLNSLLLTTLMLMPTVYLLHCCGESYRKSTLLRIAVAIWFGYLVMLVYAQFTTSIYYYSPEGELVYGPWYPASILLLCPFTALTLTGVIRRRDRLSKRLYRLFLVFLIPLTATIFINAFVDALPLVYLSITVLALSMFVIAVSEQVDHHIRLQQETASQRASIAVLRMRPHFIHNTMTSIYYLCDQDPKLAQQLTMDFNTYLRKNFTAIAQDNLIPVTEELEHTRAYLAVEQAQYQSKLVIHYDTPHTRFFVPPLTLQPLAENAVKHGMSPQTVPLHVTIRTHKTETASEVVVEDTGPGFDPAVAERPDTTLHNTRQRLEMMCGGTLEIRARDGGGTQVRVTIPDGATERTLHRPDGPYSA